MQPNFTVVIPYHAAPETFDFLRRQLNYYHHNSTIMKVIMAVSGDEDVQKRIKELLTELDDDRFSIFTVQERNIKNNEAFVQKIYDALKLVQTPYVVLNGADDVVIPEMVSKGAAILAENPDIAATKGYTFGYEKGSLFYLPEFEIPNDNPFERLKEYMKDRDSFFYIIRRTKELLKEFSLIMNLLGKDKIIGESLYHIEHLMCLLLVDCGKIVLFKYPWRIFNSHVNNHTSHTPASFIRVEKGVINKQSYKFIQSESNNLVCLSYWRYKLLWIFHQTRGISINLRQVIYRVLHKKCTLKDGLHITIYLFFHKMFVMIDSILAKKSIPNNKIDMLFNHKSYGEIKKYYFEQQ